MIGADGDGLLEARRGLCQIADAAVGDAKIDVRIRELGRPLRHRAQLRDAALVQPLLEIADGGQVALAQLRGHACAVRDREAGSGEHLEPDRRALRRLPACAPLLGLRGAAASATTGST